MWESVMDWLGTLSPFFTNVLIGYWVYAYVQSRHYAILAGILALFVFNEFDHIKRKIDLQSDRILALHRQLERHNHLV